MTNCAFISARRACKLRIETHFGSHLSGMCRSYGCHCFLCVLNAHGECRQLFMAINSLKRHIRSNCGHWHFGIAGFHREKILEKCTRKRKSHISTRTQSKRSTTSNLDPCLLPSEKAWKLKNETILLALNIDQFSLSATRSSISRFSPLATCTSASPMVLHAVGCYSAN